MRRVLPLLGLLVLLTTLDLQSPLNGPVEAAGVDRQRPALLDCTGKDGVSAEKMRQAQEAWARYLGCKVEETVEIGKGVKMTFILVPPGKFRMGLPADEKEREDDESLHTVILPAPFLLGKYEVTQAQYEALTGKNPSRFQGANLPVEKVTWNEVRDYAAKLTKKRGVKQAYRLPTEAEWEYSCRGGRPTFLPFGIGDGLSLSSAEANFDGNFPFGKGVKGPFPEKTCLIGSFQSNALGLYDMHGNVWEWCADWYGSYPEGQVTNPTGPSEGRVRVCRGGGWDSDAEDCRAGCRKADVVGRRFRALGFRLARSIPATRK